MSQNADKSLPYEKCTVIIPTYNEGSNIVELLETLFKIYPSINVIVADDESFDGTQQAVIDFQADYNLSSERLRLLERINPKDKGITASVLEGMQLVTTPYTAVMDGDLQHPPQVFRELIAAFSDNTDLVIGTRIPYKENHGILRISATRISTYIAKVFLRAKGYKVKDPMSGFFIGKTEDFLDAIKTSEERFEPRGYKILFDFLRICKKKLRFKEVMYQFAFRTGGKSKLRPAHAYYFLRSLIK